VKSENEAADLKQKLEQVTVYNAQWEQAYDELVKKYEEDLQARDQQMQA